MQLTLINHIKKWCGMSSHLFKIVEADQRHVPYLAANIRKSDRAEVWASHAATPEEALRQSLALSTRAWCARLGQNPVAMWGVGASHTAMSATGSPWLLATPGISGLKRQLLKLSRHYIALMHQDFPVLENYVHAGNSASIRWLRRCGFSLESHAAPYGPFNQPFYRFWRKQCATSHKTHTPDWPCLCLMP